MGSQERYYSLNELTEELYLGIDTVLKYLKGNKFPNAFKLSALKGGWHIPQKDVVNFMRTDEKYKKIKKAIDTLENSKEVFLTVKQVAETLNKTEDTVRKYIKNKIFPNVLSLPSKKGGHHIPVSDLEKYMEVSQSSYNTKESANLLQIHEETILNWLKRENGPIKGAYKTGKEWCIPKKEVHGLIEKIKGSYSVSEVMGILGIARNTTLKWAKNKKFPNAFKVGENWWIPKMDLEALEDNETDDPRLSINGVCELLNLRENVIYRLVNNDEFPNAEKTSNGWRIPKEDIEAHINKSINKTINLCTAIEAAEKLDVDINTIRKWAKEGRFPNAVKISGKGWKIPKDDIINFIEERDNKSKLSIQEVATRLGYYKGTILKWLNDDSNNVFPNAYKTNSGWIIPEGDLSTLNDQLKAQKVTIQVSSKEYMFLWNPEKLDELHTLIKHIKNIIDDRDLVNFSKHFISDKRTVFEIVNQIHKHSFREFIFDICAKIIDLRPKKITNQFDLISAPRVYRVLTEGSVTKGIQSENLSYYQPIMPFLRELIGGYNGVNEEKLLKSLVELDCETFWELSKSFYPSRLVTMLFNKYNNEFERYVEHCGNQIKKRGKLVKVMSLISYCFYGEIDAEKSSHLWSYCRNVQIFYDVVNDIYDDLLHNYAGNYNYQNDKWNIIYKRVEAGENRTLDFSVFQEQMKFEVMDYIKSLLKTNEDRLKIQSRLNGIKKVCQELFLLPYDSIFSFVDINYLHVHHLLTHFQNIRDNQGNRFYKLSTIKGFFTEMRLFYDWISNREESLEGIKANPFRKYSFPNIDAYIENTEYIPEEVIDQLVERLEELPANYRSAWLIMMNTGMRISDVLELEEDCYSYDDDLDVFILSYIPQKIREQRLKNGLSDYHEIPVDRSLIECIENQIEDTKDLRLLVTNENYKKHIFLVSNGYNITLPYSSDVANKINNIVDKYDIRNENGIKFHYKNHMCRKTVIVDLLSKGSSIEEVADYVSHLSIKTTERSYREINQKKIAELDLEFFDELFNETLDDEIKEQFSFEERKSLMAEIKLGTRETPEGHGHCAKHVSFGPCVKKSCVGCKMLVTGPQKLPMWSKLYNEQQAYMKELEEEYRRNGITDYSSHRMYQEQERLLKIYKDTIEQVTDFALKRGIPIEENN